MKDVWVFSHFWRERTSMTMVIEKFQRFSAFTIDLKTMKSIYTDTVQTGSPIDMLLWKCQISCPSLKLIPKVKLRLWNRSHFGQILQFWIPSHKNRLQIFKICPQNIQSTSIFRQNLQYTNHFEKVLYSVWYQFWMSV